MQNQTGISIQTIVECSMEELREIARQSDLGVIESWYSNVLLSYLVGDKSRLKQLVLEQTPKAGQVYDSESALMYLIATAKLRLAITEGAVTLSLIESTRNLAPKEPRNHTDVTEAIALGELCFVVSTALSLTCRDQEAKLATEQGVRYFELGKANKKALRCLLNALADESRIAPEKSYIADYLYIAKRALHLREFAAAATSYYNISCEYRKIGAYSAALSYVNKSLSLLTKHLAGRQYYEVLAQRCHLLMNLDSYWEARTDYELLLLSPFQETQEAVAVLVQLFPKLRLHDEHPDSDEVRNPNWRERLNLENLPALGELEDKLLQILSEGPIDRLELISRIYGDSLPLEHAENRLKNLINRARKKVPGTIVSRNGYYEFKIDSQTISRVGSRE